MKQEITNLKECPYCGQMLIPFKLGICICGRQVGSIQYVNDFQKFAKNYYSFVDYEKYDTLDEDA